MAEGSGKEIGIKNTTASGPPKAGLKYTCLMVVW